jgi:hypothetical protein
MHFLCGEKGETFTEIEAHLIAEYALCARAGAVGLHCSVFADMT